MKFKVTSTDWKGNTRIIHLPWNLLTQKEKFDAVAVPLAKVLIGLVLLYLFFVLYKLAWF